MNERTKLIVSTDHLCPYAVDFSGRDVFDLQVASDGSVTGTVTGTLLTADICDNRPGWDTFSQIIQPTSIVRVEGTRDTDPSGKLRMQITKWTQVQTAQLELLSCVQGALCQKFLHADAVMMPNSVIGKYPTYLGAAAELGRPARLSPAPAVITDTSVAGLRFIFTRQGNLVGQSAGQPRLSLTSEMRQPEIYLRGVTLPDQIRYEATAEWDSASGGAMYWSLGDTFRRDPPTGTTTQTVFFYDVDAGGLQAPTTRLTAQAVNALGTASVPGEINLMTAPPPDWSGGPSWIQARFGPGQILYEWDSEDLPFTRFEALSAPLPTELPFFGGSPIGFGEVAVNTHTLVVSTGQGSVAGRGASAFLAMGDESKCEPEVWGTLRLDPDGVHLSNGELDLSPEPLARGSRLGDVVPGISGSLDFSSIAGENVALNALPAQRLPLVLRDEDGRVELEPADWGMLLRMGTGLTVAPGVVFTASGDAMVSFQTRPPQISDVDGGFWAQMTLTRGPYVHTTGDYWPVKAGPSTAPSQAVHAQETRSATWRLADRGYQDASNYARWTAPAVRAASLAGGEVDTQLVENVQPQARPALGCSATQRLLLWSHDTPGAPALSAQDLAYSRSCNGCAPDWQPWQLATDESGSQARADLAPRVAFLDTTNALAVWERFDTATPPDFASNPAGYLSHSQVAAARWDGSVWSAPHQLSISGSLNDRPQVAAIDGGALAVWIGNATNRMTGDAAHPDRLLFARYDAGGGTWTAAATVTNNPVGSGPNLPGVLSCSLASNGTHAAVVFSLDNDGNLATADDRELYVVRWQGGAWAAPQRLTDDTVADSEPSLALAGDGNPLLVWRKGSALAFLRGAWDAAATPLDMPAALAGGNRALTRHADGHLALVWEQNADMVGQIGYAIYDTYFNAWSDAREVSALAPPDGQLTTVRNTAPAFGRSNGQDTLLVAYQLVSSDLVTKTVDGVTVTNVPEEKRHDLRMLEIQLDLNLAVAPADLALAPGGSTLSALVHNTGVWGVPDVPVRLRIIRWSRQPGTPSTVVAELFQNVAIPAGQAAAAAFTLPLAVTPDLLLYVTVDPQWMLEESTRDDNSATLGAALAITPLASEYDPNGVTVQAEVRQIGPAYIGTSAPLRLHRDGPSGPVVAEASADFPATPANSVTATAWVDSTVLGSGYHLLFWESDAGDPVPAAVSILPDLATSPELIGFGRDPGPTAGFVVRVENRGNWASPATSLHVLDGPPAAACTHVLLTLPVPALLPGDGADLTGPLNLAGTPAASSGLRFVDVQIDPSSAVEELDETNNVIVAGTLPTAPDAEVCYPVRRPRRWLNPH